MHESFEERVLREARIDKAFHQAEQVLARHAIDPREFTQYKDVEKDLAFVDRLEKEFQQETPDKLAVIFEALVHQGGGAAKWFGEEAQLIKTSRYDDIVNGVDEVVEFRTGPRAGSHLALAIDVTTGTHLYKKMHRIKSEIENGQLAEIKYFASEHMHIEGRMRDIPRVVVGAEQETVRELVNLLLDGKKKEVAEHPVHIQLLEEIYMQLVVYRKYAREHGQDELVAIYDEHLRLVEGVFEEKELTPGKHKERFAEEDEVFKTLATYLDDIGSAAHQT